MILPFGGEREPDLVALMAAGRRWEIPAQPEPVAEVREHHACTSRSGLERKKHAADKDGRCVFCDRPVQKRH